LNLFLHLVLMWTGKRNSIFKKFQLQWPE
jgi:hypothetical protein